MKQGRGACGTFKAFNLTYLYVLPIGMVYITVTSTAPNFAALLIVYD